MNSTTKMRVPYTRILKQIARADEEVKHEDRRLLKETEENEALIASSRRFGEAVDLKESQERGEASKE